MLFAQLAVTLRELAKQPSSSARILHAMKRETQQDLERLPETAGKLDY